MSNMHRNNCFFSSTISKMWLSQKWIAIIFLPIDITFQSIQFGEFGTITKSGGHPYKLITAKFCFPFSQIFSIPYTSKIDKLQELVKMPTIPGNFFLQSLIAKLLAFLAFALFQTSFSYAQQTIYYSDPSKSINISEDAYYLIDSSQTLSQEEFQRKPLSELKKGLGILTLGNVPGQVWVRFQIANLTGEHLFLSVTNRGLHLIECYSDQEGQEMIISKGGLRYPKNNQEYKGLSSIFPLGKQATQVYVLLYTKDSFGSAFYLSSALSVIQDESKFHFYTSAMLWIPSILGFFAFIAFLSSGNKLIGIYVLLQIGNVLMIGEGVIASFDHPLFLSLFSYVRPKTFTIVIFLIFAFKFLKLKKTSPYAYRLLIFMMIVAFYSRGIDVFLAGFSDLGWQDHSIYHILYSLRLPKDLEIFLWVLIEVAVYLVAWHIAIKGYKEARFFILGFTLALIGGSLSLLAQTGILPMFPFNYAYPILMVTDSVFFAFAIAEQINIIRKERERVQVDLIRQMREVQIYQQRLLDLRDEIARDLHDEIGSGLTNLSIFSDILRQDPTKRNPENLVLIGDRARQIMDTMSDLVWSVNPKNDCLENVFIRMRVYAVDILEPQAISVHFDFSGEEELLSLSMNKRKELYLIFKEAVNNCARHSNATEVRIGISRKDNLLEFRFQDNGKGFKIDLASGTDQGNGLRKMRIRAEALQGLLRIIASPGEGVAVSLRFPVT